MKLVTAAQMREIDRRTIAEFGIPGALLMRRAGDGVGSAVIDLARKAGLARPRIQLVAGKGNNGGDAYVAAAFLKRHGYAVEVLLAGTLHDVAGDALFHLNRMLAEGVFLRELPEPSDWVPALSEADVADIVVDGILGTGLQGPARGISADAIRCINAAGDKALVVAIDIPSGLNADTGEAPGETVRADITVTMGLPKAGLVQERASEYVGVVNVVDIGIPEPLVTAIPDGLEMIDLSEVRASFKPRPRGSHKGDYGHVLVIGGAAGFAGAPAMAAHAALRAGAGLVSALVPKSIASTVAALAQEIMVHGAPETEAGSLSASLWTEWQEKLDRYDAILIGPGMTTHEQTRQIVARILKTSERPVVLDADGLNVFSDRPRDLRAACPLVITPHPGEMARLLGGQTADIQADRQVAAKKAMDLTGAVVVLKGAGTLVAAKGHPISINMTGNPGMATGGSGDVLGGMLAGFLAQGLDGVSAARAAVYLHGRAGDNAALRGSQAGLIAGDLIAELPRVLRDVQRR